MEFKVGDWVRSNGHICQITEVKPFAWDNSRIEIHTEYATHMDTVELWQPKPDEWVWYGYELVQVIDNSDTIKICRQNSDSYEEVTLDKLEPFINTLPSFIKDN